MKAADGVMLVSPVYTGNVSGLMKTFMDRLAWAAHRPIFLGKPAMLAATASMGTSDALRALSWFRYTGLEVVAQVGWPVWPSPRRAWRRSASDDKKLQRAVDRFRRAMLHPSRSLSLRQVVGFSLMKITADVEPEFFSADHDYHRDIEALGLEVRQWKKLVGAVIYRVGLAWLRPRLGEKPRRSAARPSTPREEAP
jgi:multimeric flavodoxin WrbA